MCETKKSSSLSFLITNSILTFFLQSKVQISISLSSSTILLLGLTLILSLFRNSALFIASSCWLIFSFSEFDDITYQLICIIRQSMESKWEIIVRERFDKESGRLDLGQLNIEDKDIPEIIEACRKFQNIRELNLNQNKIGAEGIKYLAAANLPHLKELYIDWNHIGDEGVKHLSAANFLNLTDLSLYWNNIGDEGVKHLAVANFPNLAWVNLVNNNIKLPNKTYLSLLFQQKKIEYLAL